MSSRMRQQRQEVIEYLDAVEAFDALPNVPLDSGDIENAYQRALGPATVGSTGKQGVLAVWRSVFAPLDQSDDFGRVFQFRHRVDILEDVLINRGASGTGISRDEWAEMIAATLTAQFQPTVARSPLIVDKDGVGDSFGGVEDESGEVKEFPTKYVVFTCTGTLLAATQSFIEKPVIDAGDPGAIVMTSATPGAAIFYTIDGTKPRPGKTLDTAPFAASGVTIKARAYLIGYLQPGSTDRDSITTATV